MVGGAYSSCSVVILEVPQGSVLGTALFLLYINDILTNIYSQLFTDITTRDVAVNKGLVRQKWCMDHIN